MDDTTSALATLRRQRRMLQMTVWASGIYVWGTSFERFAADRAAHYERVKRRWVEGTTRIVGFEPRIVEGSTAPAVRGRLVVANHRSPLDVLALMRTFGGHFLANHRVATAPIVGPSARAVDTVFVDRDDQRSGSKAVRHMRRLLAEGRTVVVFPEGTTHAGDEVRPFQAGAFVAASGLPVDLVPVGLAYTPGHEFEGGTLGGHVRAFMARPSTPAWLAIGEPVPFPAQRKGVEDTMRSAVQALVQRARAAAVAEGVPMPPRPAASEGVLPGDPTAP